MRFLYSKSICLDQILLNLLMIIKTGFCECEKITIFLPYKNSFSIHDFETGFENLGFGVLQFLTAFYIKNPAMDWILYILRIELLGNQLSNNALFWSKHLLQKALVYAILGLPMAVKMQVTHLCFFFSHVSLTVLLEMPPCICSCLAITVTNTRSIFSPFDSKFCFLLNEGGRWRLENVGF